MSCPRLLRPKTLPLPLLLRLSTIPPQLLHRPLLLHLPMLSKLPLFHLLLILLLLLPPIQAHTALPSASPRPRLSQATHLPPPKPFRGQLLHPRLECRLE